MNGGRPGLCFFPPETRSLAGAIALSHALIARTAQDGALRLALSFLEEPAIALGSLLRAGSAVNMERAAQEGVPVFRRATSGPAAFAGGLFWALTLPRLDALFPDAKPETLLNRNVRPFLRGLSRAGLSAHYFGREWIHLRRRPAMLLGFEQSRQGTLLIEGMLGVNAPVSLGDALRAPRDLAVDRLRGQAAVSLAELPPVSCAGLFEAVLSAFADQAGLQATLDASFSENELPILPDAIQSEFDPIPFDCNPPVYVEHAKIPIGWLEAAARRAEDGSVEAWVGGDLMAPAWAMKEAAVVGDVDAQAPLLGAEPGDVRAIVREIKAKLISAAP